MNDFERDLNEAIKRYHAIMIWGTGVDPVPWYYGEKITGTIIDDPVDYVKADTKVVPDTLREMVEG